MPPRKRARVSAASTPAGEKAPEKAAAPLPAPGLAKDPWTNDEETQLFKALIKWKPTGIHKHLHMITIADDLRSHGYAYSPTSGDHTKIPGIWAKLETLYDLDALDTREDEYSGWADTTGEDEEERKSFSLPEETYGEDMWQRRLQTKTSDKQLRDGDVEMKDADAESRETSPELIEGLNSTQAYIRDRPPDLQMLVDKAAIPVEGAAISKGKAKKTAATRSSSGRTRATRSTPVQETEDDQEDEAVEEDESTTVGSPPSSNKGQAKGGKKRAPTRKSTRKSTSTAISSSASKVTKMGSAKAVRQATKKTAKGNSKTNTKASTKRSTRKK